MSLRGWFGSKAGQGASRSMTALDELNARMHRSYEAIQRAEANYV